MKMNKNAKMRIPASCYIEYKISVNFAVSLVHLTVLVSKNINREKLTMMMSEKANMRLAH